MPTLEERAAETSDQTEERLRAKCGEFDISMEFCRYIEMMERYLLQVERRIIRLEKYAELEPMVFDGDQQEMVSTRKNNTLN